VRQPTNGLWQSTLQPQNPIAMNLPSPILRIRQSSSGFTLVELMIAVVVLGILLAVAYPSFIDAVRKSRRSDAMAAVAAVQQAQERWRANNPAFADNGALTATPPLGLGQLATSSSGYYTVAITAANASSYTVTATAVSGKTQAYDTNCKVMGVRTIGGIVSYGGGSSTPDWADANRCWNR
jgi:type IV pilus assembly protein PilE